MKRLIPLSFILAISAATAQTYQAKEVNITDYEETYEYLKKTESPQLMIYSDLMKSSIANEAKMMRYQFALTGDILEVTQLRGDAARTITLEKSGGQSYVKDLKNQRIEVDYRRSGNPTLYLMKYVKLEENEAHSEAYQKLSREYGDKAPAYRAEVVLEEATAEDMANELHVEKNFEVTAVSVSSDEEARALAEEYLDTRLYNPYHRYSQNTLDQTFVGMEYKVKINGPMASIKAGALSFSSPVEQIDDHRYRVEVGRAYYDFIVTAGKDGAFNVERVEHAEYIPRKDEYADTPAYQALSKKYGEKIPYFIITQQVKEVSEE